MIMLLGLLFLVFLFGNTNKLFFHKDLAQGVANIFCADLLRAKDRPWTVVFNVRRLGPPFRIPFSLISPHTGPCTSPGPQEWVE